MFFSQLWRPKGPKKIISDWLKAPKVVFCKIAQWFSLECQYSCVTSRFYRNCRPWHKNRRTSQNWSANFWQCRPTRRQKSFKSKESRMDFLETIYHFPEIVGIFGGLCVLPCGRDPSNVVFSRTHDPFNKSLRDHHEPRPHEVVGF